jgi:hypothetical protein
MRMREWKECGLETKEAAAAAAEEEEEEEER